MRSPDSTTVAAQAGLRYVTDAMPGITRTATKDSFRYVDADGAAVNDEATLARIKSLAIPPAWTDVWICPWANGHIQATGRDAKRRKQYRYHPRWRSVRDEAKYERMLSFGRALPAIRRHVAEALQLPGLPREKVLATIVYLLQATMMRIGNEEYARQNKSFGLTTLRDRHVRIDGSEVAFRFRGKSGVSHAVRVDDPCLARILRRIRDLPGQELFQLYRRRRAAAHGGIGGRKRLSARADRRRVHCKGFPYLVRHRAGGAGFAGIREIRFGSAGTQKYRARHRGGRRTAR
jgi:DNA topoisomerase-1